MRGQSPTSTTLLLRIDEAARELALGKRTVERMLADGKLTPVRLGRSVRVERHELEQLVERARGERPPLAATPAPTLPITEGQVRAFYAKLNVLARLRETSLGEEKDVVLEQASTLFGRSIESVKELSSDEAHELLNELQRQVEAEA